MGVKKTYTISWEESDNGNQLTRTNDGFNAFELLAILEIAKDDIIKGMKSKEEQKIDVIKKQVVKDEK